MENIEQVEKWFEELYDYSSNQKDFDNMENKPAECEQVCAVIFLYEKLKKDEKKQNYFFHGEHDILYIGSDLDIFEDFTKEDVKKALAFGISLSSEGDGFEIYASM
jgi:hypothetical protein